MIELKRPTLWHRLLRAIPSCRRAQDAALEEAIRTLVADPSLPCIIEGVLIQSQEIPANGRMHEKPVAA